MHMSGIAHAVIDLVAKVTAGKVVAQCLTNNLKFETSVLVSKMYTDHVGLRKLKFNNEHAR